MTKNKRLESNFVLVKKARLEQDINLKIKYYE